jgi:hypothetical protein
MRDLTRQVQNHAASHAASSQAVTEATTRVLEGARKSGGRMPPVLRRLEELGGEARSLAGGEEREPGSGSGQAQGSPIAESLSRATARPA